MSVHRLRNLCATPVDRALVDAALAWTARVRGRTSNPAATNAPDELEPLFADAPVAGDQLDPAFKFQGFARPPLNRSNKSTAKTP